LSDEHPIMEDLGMPKANPTRGSTRRVFHEGCIPRGTLDCLSQGRPTHWLPKPVAAASKVIPLALRALIETGSKTKLGLAFLTVGQRKRPPVWIANLPLSDSGGSEKSLSTTADKTPSTWLAISVHGYARPACVISANMHASFVHTSPYYYP